MIAPTFGDRRPTSREGRHHPRSPRPPTWWSAVRPFLPHCPAGATDRRSVAGAGTDS